ncbi:MAG: putative toxin-antitoxin system toxin component, PIN family [Chloroflexi bacterium]|nr:putative toxin-antitoxin system toxin component, PIN family [Chloroflexota bacterium]
MLPRAVIDTNESMRAAARDTSPVRKAWADGRFEWVTSRWLIEEFSDVSSRARVQQYLTPERAALFMELLRARSILVTPAEVTLFCRDETDLPLIGTALAGDADYLVTSDRDLLEDAALREALERRGVRVITYDQFMQELD